MKIANFIEKWLNTFGKELLQEYKDYNYLWEVFFLKPKNKKSKLVFDKHILYNGNIISVAKISSSC